MLLRRMIRNLIENAKLHGNRWPLGRRLAAETASREQREGDRRGLSTMAQDRPAALFIAADAYFFSRSDHIITHVARLRIPAIYPRRAPRAQPASPVPPLLALARDSEIPANWTHSWFGFSLRPPDQCPQIRTGLRSASQVPRFPAPVAAKTGTMPAHQGFGPDGRDGTQDWWKPAIQLDEE